MEQLTIRYKDGNHCSLAVTEVYYGEDYTLYAYNGNKPVGMWKQEALESWYLTKRKEVK